MWVNKKEFEQIQERLADLERKHQSHVADVVACRNFDVFTGKKAWVHTPYGGLYEKYDSRTISIKDVVQKIMDRLGMQLTYVEGNPESVDLAKVKK